MLILAGITINILLGPNSIFEMAKNAQEKTTEGQAREQVDLAVSGLRIKENIQTMTQEEKRAELENRLKGYDKNSTVEINGTGFSIKHRGYEFEIDDKYKIDIKEPFVASEWDKTATPEECFIWGSNTEGEQGYNTIIGYNESLKNYTDVKIPSRCVKFGPTYGTGMRNEILGRENAVQIESIEFPSTLKVINGTDYTGEYGFSSLKKVIIPDSTIKIGDSAFWGCQNLEDITLSKNLIEFGYHVFHSTKWYNNQPDGLVYIGNVLYEYKGTMPENTSINIKEGTRVIANNSFESSHLNLTSVTIPNSVVSIGNFAFDTCRNLNNIELPNDILWVGYQAFYNTGWYNSQPDGLVYIGNVLYGYKGTIPENTNIKEGTRVIASWAFNNSSNNLISITMPNSVISIGESAFGYCKSLKNVEMSENVQYMGEGTFSGCTNLENIVIYKNVELLGYRTFERWTGTQNIKFETEKVPASWDDNWNYECNANIVYAYSGI